MATVGVKDGSPGGIAAHLGPGICQISLAAQLNAQPGGVARVWMQCLPQNTSGPKPAGCYPEGIGESHV